MGFLNGLVGLYRNHSDGLHGADPGSSNYYSNYSKLFFLILTIFFQIRVYNKHLILLGFF